VPLSSVLDGNSKPWHLRKDRGSEFKNKAFSRLLKEMGVKHLFSSNEKNSYFAERTTKTIKSKLSRYMSRHQPHRWIDVLKSVTDRYKGTYLRSIKMSPKSVSEKPKFYYGRCIPTRVNHQPLSNIALVITSGFLTYENLSIANTTNDGRWNISS
jgi:hypothetical protein